MKCELKYVGHGYIKAIKSIYSFEGVVIGIAWCVLCLLVIKYFGEIGVIIGTIILTSIFVILSYNEGIQYCKNRLLNEDDVN